MPAGASEDFFILRGRNWLIIIIIIINLLFEQFLWQHETYKFLYIRGKKCNVLQGLSDGIFLPGEAACQFALW